MDSLIQRLVLFSCQHIDNETLPFRLYHCYNGTNSGNKLFISEDEYNELLVKLRVANEMELAGALLFFKMDEQKSFESVEPKEQSHDDIQEEPHILFKNEVEQLMRKSDLQKSKQAQYVFNSIFADTDTIYMESIFDDLFNKAQEKEKGERFVQSNLQNAAIFLASLVGQIPGLQSYFEDCKAVAGAFKADKILDSLSKLQIIQRHTDFAKIMEEVSLYSEVIVEKVADKKWECVSDEELETNIRLRLYVLDNPPRLDEYRYLQVLSTEGGNWYNQETAEIVLNQYATEKAFSTYKFKVTYETQLLLDELVYRRKKIEKDTLFNFCTLEEWNEKLKQELLLIGFDGGYLELRNSYKVYKYEAGLLNCVLDRAFVCRKLGAAFSETELKTEDYVSKKRNVSSIDDIENGPREKSARLDSAR